ncbi:TIMELESS domain-containing protein [Psidium guajava]|nr:TIMELESS domain-containing protein [Psidium guajava]
MKILLAGMVEVHYFHASSRLATSPGMCSHEFVAELIPNIVEHSCLQGIPDPRIRERTLQGCSQVHLITTSGMPGKVLRELIPVLARASFDVEINAIQNCVSKRPRRGLSSQEVAPEISHDLPSIIGQG